MTPAAAQQQALDTLEELGGKPVVLREAAALANHSVIHIAAASEPAHVLTYRSSATPELPYLVCFQVVMAARTLRAAPDERFNVASTPDTYIKVEKLVAKNTLIPPNMATAYTRMITDGLGTQLRSVPIGIRVDRSLHEEHPELRPMQRRVVEQQFTENAGVLSPSVRAFGPDMFIKASVGMNAAFAIAWSRLWGEAEHVAPYRLAGYMKLGEKLMAKLDSIPDSPTHDRELVSAWAELLGIDSLYRIGPVGL
jgi:hypothetical protein